MIQISNFKFLALREMYKKTLQHFFYPESIRRINFKTVKHFNSVYYSEFLYKTIILKK